MFAIDAAFGVLRDLHVDESVLAPIEQLLADESQNLRASPILDLQLADSVFGGSEPGRDLGSAHGLAQRVISETIIGVSEDLARFRSGLVQAQQLVTAADDAAAGDLQAKQQAAEVIVASTQFSAANARNREARNAVLGGD